MAPAVYLELKIWVSSNIWVSNDKYSSRRSGNKFLPVLKHCLRSKNILGQWSIFDHINSKNSCM